MNWKNKAGKMITLAIVFIMVLAALAFVFLTVPHAIKGDPPFSNNGKVNTDAGTAAQDNPVIGVDSNGVLYVAWEDDRSGDSDIYFANSTDGGATWTNPNVKINTDFTTEVQSEPCLAVDSAGNVYVAWRDGRNGNYDIYFARSTNGGANWTDPNIKVNTDVGTERQSDPSIAVDSSGTIYMAWGDKRNGDWDVYFAKSSDGGLSWTDPNIKVNTDTTSTDQRSPSIAVDSSNDIYIAWQDERNGDTDIYFAKSTNGGVDWTDPNVIVNTDDTSLTQVNPTLAVDSSGTVYVAWEDFRDGDADIYFAKSTNGGADWTDPNIKVNTDTGSNGQHSPAIAMSSNGIIYLAWHDDRQGDRDIYFASSIDGGVNWKHPNIRVNDDSGSEAQTQASLVVHSNSAVYVAWQDYRSTTNYDIWFASLVIEPIPPIVYDLSVDGFLGSTPGIQHIIQHTPDLGFTYSDFNSDSLTQYNISVWDSGDSTLLWWYNNTISLPSGSTETVTYNTDPAPTNGPALEDGTTYKFRASAENSSGVWSAVSQVDFHLNEIFAPTTPVSPLDDSLIVASTTQTVTWSAPADAEGDTLNYTWEIATDSGFSSIIESGSGLATESGAFDTTSLGDFYWRVKLTDGWETSSYGNQPDGFWNFTAYAGPTTNNPPTITNKESEPNTANVNSTVTFTFTASDADSDTLTWSKVSGPAWLSIGSTNGTIYGTPSSGDSGQNTFTIQVSDGKGGTDDHTFTITVDGEQNGDGEEDGDADSMLPLVLIIIIIVIIIVIIAVVLKRR